MHSREYERGTHLQKVLEITEKTPRDLARLIVSQRTKHNLKKRDFPRSIRHVTKQLQAIVDMTDSASSLVLCYELAAATKKKPFFYHRGCSFGEEGDERNHRLLTLLQEAGLTPVKKSAR